MNYNPKIHNLNHYIKSVVGRTEFLLSGIRKDKNELLVLNYHGIQRSFLDRFEEQLDLLEKYFDFVSVDDVENHYQGQNKSKPGVFLTFDDGIKNNLRAAEILQRRKIRALFLIVPDFVDCPEDQQPDFFKRNIRPIINHNLDTEPEDTKAMSWDDLRSLLKAGHAIGSHSMTHTMVAGKSDRDTLEYEIVKSKNRIHEMTGVESAYFCAPNNSLYSCGEEEMKLIRKHYDYFLSTFSGSNSREREKYFIKRSNVEAFWLPGAFRYAIGNWDQRRWKNSIRQFGAVLSASGS